MPQPDKNAKPLAPVARRAAGQAFLGYDLDDAQRPTFRYRCGTVLIADTPREDRSDAGTRLRRALVFRHTKPDQQAATLWLRAAVAKKITAIDGGYRVQPNLHIRTSVQGTLHQTPAGTELRFPIRLTKGQASLTLDYSWRRKDK